jgi:hypothetical protein
MLAKMLQRCFQPPHALVPKGDVMVAHDLLEILEGQLLCCYPLS